MTRSLALLADIGGTNVRFALGDLSQRSPLMKGSERRYLAADFSSLADAARRYFGDSGTRPVRAVFAVAGRVDGDEVRMTNHPWRISIAGTREDLALESLRVVNDFCALATALPLLAASEIEAIGPAVGFAIGSADTQTLAVLGPGTGLGVAALMIRNGRTNVLASEGGHAGFAPGTAQEIEMLRRLGAKFGRVSNERLISGNGLLNIYRTLCEISGVTPGSLTPEQIVERATNRSGANADPLCVSSVEYFGAIFGAVAGDLALGLGAWDGVFLAGGLVPALLPWLEVGEFRRRFEDKGRFASAMERVPTLAIVHPHPGLLGSGAVAVAEAAAAGT